MGVSFIGIACKANERQLIDLIIETNKRNGRNFEVVFDSEHPFETIVMRKPGDDIIDIYNCEQGSLCTVSYEVYERYLWKDEISKHFDVFYFDISETAMEHRFAVFKGGEEVNGMNIYERGGSKNLGSSNNFMNIQDSDDIFTRTFANAVREYLPRPFGEMMDNRDGDVTRRFRLVSKTGSVPGQTGSSEKKVKKSFFGRLFGS